MDMNVWYQTLKKPFFAPPPWLFGPAWTILYAIIFVTFGYTIYKVITRAIPSWILIPLGLNLIFNFAFTYFQFGLKNNLLASIDIVLVLATLIWFMIAIFPHLRWVALANIPYVAWVSFATILQLSITWMNH